MSRWKRLAAIASVVVLCVLAVGEAALALADIGAFRSSEDVDVVVQDEQGYQHFLVFEAIPSRVPSWSRYNIDFWVDDWVRNPGTVREIVLRTNAGVFSAPFVSARTRSNPPPQPDTHILTFGADRSALRALATRRTEHVEWTLDSGEVVRFRVLDPAALQNAAGRAD